MRVVIQRVSRASVRVDERDIAAIERGFLVLVAFAAGDGERELGWVARKIATLRIFDDGDGRMSLSLPAIDGRVLVVSQFTLYGDCRKGARPSFDRSADSKTARALYERFLAALEAELPGRVASGRFQEHMHVSSVNDGPVTVVVDRDAPEV